MASLPPMPVNSLTSFLMSFGSTTETVESVLAEVEIQGRVLIRMERTLDPVFTVVGMIHVCPTWKRLADPSQECLGIIEVEGDSLAIDSDSSWPDR